MNTPKTARRALLLVAALVAAPAATTAQADADLPPAEEIIERYVEAIGGRDAVLSQPGSHTTGTFSMPMAGIEAEMEVWASNDPTRMLTVVEIPGMGTVMEGYTGEYGWALDPNMGPRILDGLELAAMREGASELGAVRDESMFTDRTTLERAEIDGEPCFRVRLAWKSGRETVDCYSVESGLLLASETTQETPMGDIPVVSMLKDYQSFGGLLSPTRIVQRMMGQEQIITLNEVEYIEIDPEVFTPPAAIQTLIEQQGQEGS